MNLTHLDLLAHKLSLTSNITLPVNLGRGATLRKTTEAETVAIRKHLKAVEYSYLLSDGVYLCIEMGEPYKNEMIHPQRIRHALALLYDEIVLWRDLIKLDQKPNGEMLVRSIGERTHTFFPDQSPHLTTSRLLLRQYDAKIDKNLIDKIKILQSYNLSENPYVKMFAEAHKISPVSSFKFLGYMSIIEGIIGTENQTTRISDNISTKLDYFFKNIAPRLKLTSDINLPKQKGGKRLTDHASAWKDIYKIRNCIAHGDGNRLKPGKKIKEILDGVRCLAEFHTGDALKLLDTGVKSLIYWHLERPEEVADFKKII